MKAKLGITILAVGMVAMGVATPVAGAAGCGSASASPAKTSRAAYRASVLCLINRQRALAGLRALRRDRRLERAAQSHADEMVARRYFSHNSFNGTAFDRRILRFGYVNPRKELYRLGENLGYADELLASPADLVDAWMHSAAHRGNILTRVFTNIGIGVQRLVAISGLPGVTVVADFGWHKRPSRR